MAGTRISYRQLTMDPDETLELEHVEKGWVFPVDVTFTGGGNKRYVLHIMIAEPIEDEKPARRRASR